MEITPKRVGCWLWLSWVFTAIQNSCRQIMVCILRAGPIPRHIAIIMDGNRRFAQRRRMEKKTGHEFGAESLMQTLRNCYEMGVDCVTVYAFSIENFKRSREEVDALMDLMQHKLEALLEKESLVNQAGIRVRLLGNLELLPERVRHAAEKVMVRTMPNSKAILNVCVAYTSTEEIVHAVQEACQGVLGFGSVNRREITMEAIESHLYTAGCPDPDLLIRTSGESRLSNFLLWQSGFCYLHACRVLWPDFSFRHLFMAVLGYQRACSYINRRQKHKSLKDLSSPL
uniref:Alkyl transferase n=1 Tax=Araucaria cunninghamii TaxID=56994 RepID=A0A0D6R8S6_ARACU